jgi:hypothetical protein
LTILKYECLIKTGDFLSKDSSLNEGLCFLDN